MQSRSFFLSFSLNRFPVIVIFAINNRFDDDDTMSSPFKRTCTIIRGVRSARAHITWISFLRVTRTAYKPDIAYSCRSCTSSCNYIRRCRLSSIFPVRACITIYIGYRARIRYDRWKRNFFFLFLFNRSVALSTPADQLYDHVGIAIIILISRSSCSYMCMYIHTDIFYTYTRF